MPWGYFEISSTNNNYCRKVTCYNFLHHLPGWESSILWRTWRQVDQAHFTFWAIGHSINTWTQFWPPTPSTGQSWTFLWITYSLFLWTSEDFQPKLSTVPLPYPPLLVHVIIECPLSLPPHRMTCIRYIHYTTTLLPPKNLNLWFSIPSRPEVVLNLLFKILWEGYKIKRNLLTFTCSVKERVVQTFVTFSHFKVCE